MATSLDEVARMLEEIGWKGERIKRGDDEAILTGFKMRGYQNPNGQPNLGLRILVLENGGYLEIAAPGAYLHPPANPNTLALLQALLMVSWRTKLVQFEYDASDGEVRPVIELPLEDAVLTRNQLQRCIRTLCGVVDEYHGVVRKAIDEGKIEFEKSLPAMLGALAEAASRDPERLRRLLEALEREEAAGTPPPATGSDDRGWL